VGSACWWAVAAKRIAGRARQRMKHSILAFEQSAASGDDAPLCNLTRLEPDNAGAWYFLGAMHLRKSQVREAARCFGAAYHRNCDLQTAVLFTFACLKARDGEQTDIVEQLLATWNEIREKGAPFTPDDRLAVATLVKSINPTPGFSALGRLIWSAVGPTQREQLMALVDTERGKMLAKD
jgi:hypothetical protein